MILMLDSTTATDIPRNAVAVAGYVDGDFANFAAMLERFPHAHRLSISVHGNHADCADCEKGDMSPAQAVAWVNAELRRGTWRPCVYANRSTWFAPVEPGAPSLWATLSHYGAGIRRWLADYDGIAVVPTGFDAKQYNDHGPHGEHYDVSVCIDTFFPVKPAPAKPKPAPHGVAVASVTVDLAAGHWTAQGRRAPFGHKPHFGEGEGVGGWEVEPLPSEGEYWCAKVRVKRGH